MPGSPDLYVVCNNCGSEVSPYITECPYCGKRLRKRAPKIEREGEPPSRARRLQTTLPRLRPGEIPGVKADDWEHPYATIALIALSAIGWLVLVFVHRGDIAVVGPLDGKWWKLVTSSFAYAGTWYQLATVLTLGVFGWLLERRHGPVVVVALFVLCAATGAAAELAADPFPLALGGNGPALGLLAAWAVPVVLARRAGREVDEADLLGTLALAVLVAAMPLATVVASAYAGAAGLLIGGVAGLLLARLKPR